MRLVIDLQACQSGDRNRGIGRYALAWAQSMCANAGAHEVWIGLNGNFPNTIQPLRNSFRSLLPAERIVVWNAPSSCAGDKLENQWRKKAGELVREDFFNSLNADVLHICSLFDGWNQDALTSIPSTRTDTLRSVTLYDLIPLVHSKTYLQDRAFRDWYFEKLSHLKDADIVLAISGHSCREGIEALNLRPERIFNISSPATPDFYPRTPSPESEKSLRDRVGIERPFVMYTGGMEIRKNVERLIEAYSLLPKSVRSRHQLAIVCNISAWDQQRLADLIRGWSLDASEVVFTGFVSDDDLLSLYNLCKCFIFPSWHEGFGLPVLEALSCGAAVIGSNNTGIPEVIGCEEALFDPHDVRSIADKLHQTLIDEAFRSGLRARALTQSARFSVNECALKSWSAFEHAVEKRTSSSSTAGERVRSATKPLLAYVSPLPPEETGIADYSTELLPELGNYYEIEVIVIQDVVDDPWVCGNFPIRSMAWFDVHANEYDRVLYQTGNSPQFHWHMFDLLNRHPGTIVLHDFFLSGIAGWELSGREPLAWTHALYYSHGYQALVERYQTDCHSEVVIKYPCNKRVLDQADGVIVHSQHSKDLANHWYGRDFSREWEYIPLLGKVAQQPGRRERAALRAKLGFTEDDWVVCSFGHIGLPKLSRRLLDAWLASSLAKDRRCHLVFVGDNLDGEYSTGLAKAIERSGYSSRITISGYVDASVYRDYLSIADAAVQLREKSRGESSGAVMDCLNHGLPLILNAHGSNAEIPHDIVFQLPDLFSIEDLTLSLEYLRHHPEEAARKGEKARDYIAKHHDPAQCAKRYYEAMERFAVNGPWSRIREMARTLERLENSSNRPSANDWKSVSESLAQNRRLLDSVRQLLIDVSALVQPEIAPGILNIAATLLKELIGKPPAGYRVEPVYATDSGYWYARNFTVKCLGLPGGILSDTPIDRAEGDLLMDRESEIPQTPDFRHCRESIQSLVNLPEIPVARSTPAFLLNAVT